MVVFVNKQPESVLQVAPIVLVCRLILHRNSV